MRTLFGRDEGNQWSFHKFRAPLPLLQQGTALPGSHTQERLRIRMLLIFSSLLVLFPFFLPTFPSSLIAPSFPSFCRRCVLTACFGIVPLGIFLLLLQQISDVSNLHTEEESSSLCTWPFWTLEDWAGPPALQRSSDPERKQLSCPWRSRLDRLSATDQTGDVMAQTVLHHLVIVLRILWRLHDNEIRFSTYNLLPCAYALKKKVGKIACFLLSGIFIQCGEKWEPFKNCCVLNLVTLSDK